MASLYVTSAMYGAGIGIWIDAEIWPDGDPDPGLALIAPIVLGGAAPVTVWAIDTFAFRRGMPEGLPSAVASGLLIGAGEGLGIAGYQWVTADCPTPDNCDEWGFRGLARAEVVGATVGGVAGAGAFYLLRPYPETNVMWTSSIFWGTVVGSFFGGGASNGDWGQANDGVALGGLIGFNVGLAGAVGASIFWTPSWNQLGWMWGGFAIGSRSATRSHRPGHHRDRRARPRRGLRDAAPHPQALRASRRGRGRRRADPLARRRLPERGPGRGRAADGHPLVSWALPPEDTAARQAPPGPVGPRRT
jgi:hypothetical protein